MRPYEITDSVLTDGAGEITHLAIERQFKFKHVRHEDYNYHASISCAKCSASFCLNSSRGRRDEVLSLHYFNSLQYIKFSCLNCGESYLLNEVPNAEINHEDEVQRWKDMAVSLWIALDNVETAMDQYKPEPTAYTHYVNATARSRTRYLYSKGGQTLVEPSNEDTPIIRRHINPDIEGALKLLTRMLCDIEHKHNNDERVLIFDHMYSNTICAIGRLSPMLINNTRSTLAMYRIVHGEDYKPE